ncbi:Protein of unknown function (DUF2961) [Abditibacterium utsteinense]|uniref:DUF2961 domain-containing protein n=2 Tax=Abditibacterium utsteinense TaxID=1960156 RepID=A0A2S8SX74_9BACT|nr:Protein of unknown function (DUF2961) [Abditibacterium utsteinense]
MARFIKVAAHGQMRFIFCGFSLIFCGAAHAQTSNETLAALPQSPLLPAFRWFASTDPKHQNDDYFLLKPGETRRVLLAAGTLERLWSTAQFPDKLDLKIEAGPRRSQSLLSGGKTMRGLFSDKTYTFFPGLQGDSLRNLDSGATLVATNRAKEASKWFFQAAVRPKSAIFTKNQAQDSGKAREVARRFFKMKLAPGEEKVVENFDNPGQIYEFSVAADVAGAKTFHNLRLKASFDGQKAIDAPLMSLAGQIDGEELIQNAVADFDGSRLVLRWPMPFEKAQISLKNQGDAALNLDVGARVSEFEKAPTPFRFCAVQLQKTPQKGRPVEILNVKGAGALVGLAVSFKPGADSRRRAFAYLEGNELIRADGKLFEGTGTEDFFSSAWYFPDQPFLHRYEGLTQKIQLPPSASAYRFLIPDAIPFGKSLKFDFEHGSGNNAEDVNWNYAAFWYQKLPINLPVATSESKIDSKSAKNEDSAPVAPSDRWKLGAAVLAGVLLGIASRFFKRRRT